MESTKKSDKYPLTPKKLLGPKPFAASYAGEHIAGTEFVIGALFVMWGVSVIDIFGGLLIGNLFAVLTWGLITGPIATDTRLSLYAYLEKIAGPGFIRLYSVVNGVLFCILAGAMITVSASAVRIPFGIPDQVGILPTDWRFVLVVAGVGVVVVYLAVKGFHKLSRFAATCSPWLICMFIIGAMATMPIVVSATEGVDKIDSVLSFLTIAETSIWLGESTEIGFWHVAAFAWVANISMHGSLGDMSILRFAKKSQYGYFSALGMFIGHYVAWICAGIMGAGVAILLKTSITEIDPGTVAYSALGVSGIIAVIIAGWTTSNPTIYRAGLAFSSLNSNWDRKAVTTIVGAITTIIACSPFVFSELLNFVGFMGLLLAPVGAIIVAEHFIFTRIGLTRYWSKYKGDTTNIAALLSWLISMVVGIFVENHGILHLFFILLPLWFFATALYIGLSILFGAKAYYPEAKIAEQRELVRKQEEKVYLTTQHKHQLLSESSANTFKSQVALIINTFALIACIALGVVAYITAKHEILLDWLIYPTVIYFAVSMSSTFSKQ